MSDLISKSKIIEVANDFTFTFAEDKRRYMDFLNYCLDNAPTVAKPLSDCVGDCKSCWKTKLVNAPIVEPMRGEWEVVHGVMTPGGDPLLRCPVCRSKESYHMGGIEMPQHWNFCPNCGAMMSDMRGEKNEK